MTSDFKEWQYHANDVGMYHSLSHITVYKTKFCITYVLGWCQAFRSAGGVSFWKVCRSCPGVSLIKVQIPTSSRQDALCQSLTSDLRPPCGNTKVVFFLEGGVQLSAKYMPAPKQHEGQISPSEETASKDFAKCWRCTVVISLGSYGWDEIGETQGQLCSLSTNLSSRQTNHIHTVQSFKHTVHEKEGSYYFWPRDFVPFYHSSIVSNLHMT